MFMIMTFLLILIAILFGIVEGISEWLPISSTGHMILVEKIFSASGFSLRDPASLGFEHGDAFFEMFLVVIQLGAILAVIIYFWKKLWPFGNKLSDLEIVKLRNEPELVAMGNYVAHKRIWQTWLKTLVGCLPAAVVGLGMEYLKITDKFAKYEWAIVGATLIIYGIAFIAVEIYVSKKKQKFKVDSVVNMSLRTAFYIGCFQVLALIPGTSRSGVTILGALLLFCNRESAAEFSFYLSIPVMIGASGLKLFKFIKNYGMPNKNETLFLLIGFIVAFIVSLLAVKWLMGFVKRHDFKPFGYYRIALGILVFVIFVTIAKAQGTPLFAPVALTSEAISSNSAVISELNLIIPSIKGLKSI